VSFLPVLLDPQHPGDRALVFAHTFSPNGVQPLPPPSCYTLNRRSLGDGEYKYIRTQKGVNGSPCGTPTYWEELYDLTVDPEETVELITSGLTPEADTRLQILRAEMDALSGF
jgi:hypothetical protein